MNLVEIKQIRADQGTEAAANVGERGGMAIWRNGAERTGRSAGRTKSGKHVALLVQREDQKIYVPVNLG